MTKSKYLGNECIQKLNSVEFHLSGAGYLDRLVPSDKFVENSTKLICLEITCDRIKCSTVLWFLELRIRCVRKV